MGPERTEAKISGNSGIPMPHSEPNRSWLTGFEEIMRRSRQNTFNADRAIYRPVEFSNWQQNRGGQTGRASSAGLKAI